VVGPLAAWLRPHREAIYGTKSGRICPAGGHPHNPIFHYGMWTSNSQQCSFRIPHSPGEELILSRTGAAMASASLLATGEPVQVERTSDRSTEISAPPARRRGRSRRC